MGRQARTEENKTEGNVNGMRISPGKRIALLLIALAVSAVFSVSAGERAPWDCPGCGRTGNTGNFCGGCGEPAPETPEETGTEETLRLPSPEGVPATLEELEEQVEMILQLAETWTDETVPRSLEEFPFFPFYILDLQKAINGEYPVLEAGVGVYRVRYPFEAGSFLVYLPGVPDRSYSAWCSYQENENTYTSMNIIEEAPDTFPFKLPNGINISMVTSVSLSYCNDYNSPEQLYNNLSLVYPMENGTFIPDAYVNLMMSKDGPYFFVQPGFSFNGYDHTGALRIDVGGPKENSDYYWQVNLIYDMETGQLREWQKW